MAQRRSLTYLTSNGEVFDTNQMTAAHKTLPFNTLVKVTNLDNGRSAVVRINDRGPFVEGRIIDLSRTAAEDIDMVGRGVARVSLEIVSFAPEADMYAIRVGAFGREENARRAGELLESAGFVASVEKTAVGVLRVSVRGIAAKDLDGVEQRIAALGFEGYLVRREKAAAPAVPTMETQAEPASAEPASPAEPAPATAPAGSTG